MLTEEKKRGMPMHRKNWRPFEEAAEFARSLGMERVSDWREFVKTGQLPDDIPRNPPGAYRDEGWQGWGHFLGTGALSGRGRRWRPFEEAREYVRSLGFTSSTEWHGWAKSGQRPKDIPSNPNMAYAAEWENMADWLGVDLSRKQKPCRPFSEARKLARSLGLKSAVEWKEWCKGDDMPADIPVAPDVRYKDEWTNWADFLGHNRRSGGWLEFEEARERARALGLRTRAEWHEWQRSPERRPDVPISPETVYQAQWVDFADWLGKPESRWKQLEEARKQRQKEPRWRTFEEARGFARGLGLKSRSEWDKYTKSPEKPADIPVAVALVYKEEWTSWGDFLGTGNQRPRDMQFRPFAEARAYVRSLGIQSTTEWREWAKSRTISPPTPQ